MKSIAADEVLTVVASGAEASNSVVRQSGYPESKYLINLKAKEVKASKLLKLSNSCTSKSLSFPFKEVKQGREGFKFMGKIDP